MLVGPGTPRDPKSHLFANKWVAIPPFVTLKPGSGTEFRPGSRRGGPGAQIPTFSSLILDPKMPKSRFSGKVSNLSATHSNGFGAPRGPKPPRLGQTLTAARMQTFTAARYDRHATDDHHGRPDCKHPQRASSTGMLGILNRLQRTTMVAADYNGCTGP